MNVIGIIQTDLNEFNILFEQEQNGNRQNVQGNDQGYDQSNDPSSDYDGGGGFSLFGFGQGDGDSSQGNQQQNQPQEMTVRIKGIPEGEKATFLQMYQIIQDAKQMKDLRDRLTIVSSGDDQNANNQYGSSGYGSTQSGNQR